MKKPGHFSHPQDLAKGLAPHPHFPDPSATANADRIAKAALQASLKDGKQNLRWRGGDRTRAFVARLS